MDGIVARQDSISNANSIAKQIGGMLPDNVKIDCLKICEQHDELYKEESHHIRNAVKKRQQEFRAGRTCARRVLAKLHCPPCPIAVGSNREPVWPQHITASITHDGDHCIVCGVNKIHIASIGIDLALATPLKSDLIRLVCTGQEVTEIETIGQSAFVADPYKMLFSIKESVFKCLFPIVRQYFDFQDVAAGFGSGNATVSISLLNMKLFPEPEPRLKAKYCIVEDYIFTIVWLDSI